MIFVCHCHLLELYFVRQDLSVVESNLHVEQDIDLLIVVSIVELVERDLFVDEVMLTKNRTKKQSKSLFDLKNFTLRNGRANGRRGKLVVD